MRAPLAQRFARLSDRELFAIMRRSDHEAVAAAFAVVYMRHWNRVFEFLTSRTGDDDVATDLCAEVFATAFEARERFDSGRGEVRGWLFGIAKMKLRASSRKRSVEQAAVRRLGIGSRGHGDDAWAEVEERVAAQASGVLDALEELGAAERDAVQARVVDGLDYSEIASAADTSQVAIRQRVSRGLGKLARRVGRTP